MEAETPKGGLPREGEVLTFAQTMQGESRRASNFSIRDGHPRAALKVMPTEIRGCPTTEVAVMRRPHSTTTARLSRKAVQGNLGRAMPTISTSPTTSGRGLTTEVFGARRAVSGLISCAAATIATAIESSIEGPFPIARERGSITRTLVTLGICRGGLTRGRHCKTISLVSQDDR